MAIMEVHNAIVTRNTDPDEGVALRGAVFFEAQTLFDGEYPDPAFPCFPFASDKGAGMFFVPQVGDEIEVMIQADDGTDDPDDIENSEPRWRCMIYSQAADIAEEFKVNYTKRMGWKTNSGHILLFDDTINETFMQLKTGKGHNFKMDETKGAVKVILESIKKHTLLLDDTNGLIQFKHFIGTLLEIDVTGNWTETIINDKTSTISGDETITTSGDRLHTAANHTLDSAGDIKLGSDSADENLVLGNTFTAFFNLHVHIGNLGIIGGAPTTPMGALQLAARVFTELG